MDTGDGDAITILHVDDDPDFTELTAEFLEREDDGFEVLTESRGEAALDRLERTDVDCVVSDYKMPGMDGLELLEAVRETHPETPFVLFTGEGSESVAGDAISAGVTDYIQKTSGTGQYELLANRIREAVSHSRARLSYEEVFEKSGVGMTIHDVDSFDIVAANREYCDLLGFEDEECVGLSFADLTADVEGYTPDRARDHLETGRTEGSHTFEWPLVTRGGERIWTEITLEGATIGGRDRLLGTVRDVTERWKQRRRLSTLVSNLPGIVYRCPNEPGWPMDLVRGDAANLVGHTAEEIENGAVDWGDVVHPDDRERVWKTVQTAIDDDEPFTITYRIHTADGETRWVWEQGRAVRSPAGEIDTLEGFITDVTERKESRQQLRQYKQAIDGSFDLMAAVDAADEYLFANETYCEYHECDVDALRGRTVAEVVGEDAYEEARPHIEATLDGEPVRYQMTREHPERGERHLDILYAPITDDDGTVQGVVATMRDITDQKERERALAALHDAATDLEAADNEAAVHDALVGAAEEILDFDLVAVDVEQDGALVQQAWTLDIDTEGYYERTSLEEDDTLATRAYNRQETILVDDLREYEITPADSEYRSVLTVPIADIGTFQAVSREIGAFDEGDRELAELLVGHAREALQRLEHDRSLRRQRERLRRENERLEEFASIVSHDLRNPLTVARGELERAQSECESPHLAEVSTSIDRMGTIVDDVLSMARQGQIVDESELETVALGRLFDECWTTVETAAADLEVATETTLRADAERLKRAIENLVRNAVEHGGEDVTIRVGDLEDGFYVADDGPGIPSDERESVFEPGFSSREDGTGFGLPIVAEIVRAHGWSIAVTESETGGARLEITGVHDQ